MNEPEFNEHEFDSLLHKTAPSDPARCVHGCLTVITLNSYNHYCPNRVDELRQAWKRPAASG